MDQNPTKRNTLPIKIGAGVLLILIYVGVTMYVKNTRDTRLEGNTDIASNTAGQTSLNNTAYRNGTYTATGSYLTPGGQEQVTVRITIADDIITDTQVSANANVPTSKQFQAEFINNYKSFVVGKNIADLNLTKVAGSSLTSKGFNEALDKIKAEANS